MKRKHSCSVKVNLKKPKSVIDMANNKITLYLIKKLIYIFPAVDTVAMISIQ